VANTDDSKLLKLNSKMLSASLLHKERDRSCQPQPFTCLEHVLGLRPDTDGGSAAAKVEADKLGGLESYVVLARGAKVMLTWNIGKN
jgi:hypothetical protein